MIFLGFFESNVSYDFSGTCMLLLEIEFQCGNIFTCWSGFLQNFSFGAIFQCIHLQLMNRCWSHFHGHVSWLLLSNIVFVHGHPRCYITGSVTCGKVWLTFQISISPFKQFVSGESSLVLLCSVACSAWHKHPLKFLNQIQNKLAIHLNLWILSWSGWFIPLVG